jgi:hypothetical protein
MRTGALMQRVTKISRLGAIGLWPLNNHED